MIADVALKLLSHKFLFLADLTGPKIEAYAVVTLCKTDIAETRKTHSTLEKHFFFFFLNDPPTPEISPLPLPAPLPISGGHARHRHPRRRAGSRGRQSRNEHPPASRRRPHRLARPAPDPLRQPGPPPPTLPNRAGLIPRSEEHTSELQSQSNLVCRLLLE